ncbi:MAG: SPOR domain-containing protein [bacterium]|nr:SPOR domain-containing protein [bacterium]
MKFVRYFFIVAMAGTFLISCSNKKEEAAKLEQEVLNQDSGMMAEEDSITIDSQVVEPLDATAIPEEEPEVASAPDMPRRPAGDGYTVQVASCEDEAYARHLVNVYTERGYEPYVSEISIDGQLYHRVRVGMYDSFGAADQLKRELEDKYTISPWVDLVSQ